MNRSLVALGCLLSACASSAVARQADVPVSNRRNAVSISGFAFAPSEMTVTRGDSVVWTNEDPLAHTVTADSAAWSSPELAGGRRYVLVPTNAGRFPYHCAAHPVMRGVLIVK